MTQVGKDDAWAGVAAREVMESDSGSMLKGQQEVMDEVWGMRGREAPVESRGFVFGTWKVETGRLWEWQVLRCQGHTPG